jgi:hypothetical protein
MSDREFVRGGPASVVLGRGSEGNDGCAQSSKCDIKSGNRERRANCNRHSRSHLEPKNSICPVSAIARRLIDHYTTDFSLEEKTLEQHESLMAEFVNDLAEGQAWKKSVNPFVPCEYLPKYCSLSSCRTLEVLRRLS